jgi:hypothetical protein
VMGISTVRVVVENCRTLEDLEYLPDKIRTTFSLVRTAPSADCPDMVGEIAWGDVVQLPARASSADIPPLAA